MFDLLFGFFVICLFFLCIAGFYGVVSVLYDTVPWFQVCCDRFADKYCNFED